MILAKDNGSTDNITVVVVFLKPIEDILHKIRTQYHHLKNETIEEYDTVDCGASFTYIKVPGLQLDEGITSTSKFVTDDSMNGDSTENLTNGDEAHYADDTPSSGIKANNPFTDMIEPFPGLSDKQFQGDSSSDCGNNPFSSPGAQAFGGFGEVVNPFSDMSGNDVNAMQGFAGERRTTHSSSEGGDDSLDGSCNDVMILQEGGLLNLSAEEFKQASPSMFEESQSPSMFEKPPVEPINPGLISNNDDGLLNNDFVANPAHSWISSPNSNASTDDRSSQNMSTIAATGIGANPLTNPFLPHNKCGDSGFISPAGNSQHQSASSSSEDSAENREERESVERACSVGSDRQSDVASVASVHEHIQVEKRESVSSNIDEEGSMDVEEKDIDDSDDEEAKEHQEVTKLLSGGGMFDPQLGDFMASVNRETPTPPVEENGSTLEEILAAARNQPDEPGLVEDVDSDETSSDADEEVIENLSSSRKSSKLSQQFEANENLEQSGGVVECEEADSSNESSSDADDDGFTFVKKDVDNIIDRFSHSTSPLVIDTVVTEGEYTLEAETELGENLDKPEIILKSALVNPNIEVDFSYEGNEIVDTGLESVSYVQDVPTETVTILENSTENGDNNPVELSYQIEETTLNEELSRNFELISNSDNQIPTEEEQIDNISEVKSTPLCYTEETIQAVETEDINERYPKVSSLGINEITLVQSATPLQVSPAVNTLNALEDYANQDIADAESSSAPSSLESQSGPASVIIESQEVPIPDQASFIIQPTESYQFDLPSPQEAIIEVIPEEHFRERSQSPILEENEDMSDSESKSPEPTPQLNGNAFKAPEYDNTNTNINEDLQALKVTPLDIEDDQLSTLKEVDLNSSSTNIDMATKQEEVNHEKIVDLEVQTVSLCNDVKEKLYIDNNLCSSNIKHADDADFDKKIIIEQVDDYEQDRKSLVNDSTDRNTNVSREEINLLQADEPVSSDQDAPKKSLLTDVPTSLPSNDFNIAGVVVDQKEDISYKDRTADDEEEKIESETLNSQLVGEDEPLKSVNVLEEHVEKLTNANVEETPEMSPLVKGLTIACDVMASEEKMPNHEYDEPATAEVLEGKVGFYAEKDSQVDLKDSELKEEILDQKEEPKQDTEDKLQEYEHASIKLPASDIQNVEEAIDTPVSVLQQNIRTDNEVEGYLNGMNLQPENNEEISLLTTPTVNLTPATPVPETRDEFLAEIPVVKEEVEAHVEVKLEKKDPNAPTVILPSTEELKDVTKVEDKKVSQGKPAASPTLKRSTKPVAAKSSGLSSKTTGLSTMSPKLKLKPTATRPGSGAASRMSSSTNVSKSQTSGSTSQLNKRPTSGLSTASKASSVGTSITAKSTAPTKTAPRQTTTRTAPTTTTRQPLTARAPAAKPKTTGAGSSTLGTKPLSPTARPMVSRPLVTKTKVDETKKTATSSVAARSTLPRTASPASGSRSRTPLSPKTTAPKPTRPITSTTPIRSTLTSTTTSRASTKAATATTTVAAARKAPTPRTAPVKTTTTAVSSRTTTARTMASSTRTTLSSTSPAKSKPVGSDMMRRPLVPSGPRPTDLTKKRILSAKDKQQQSNGTKSNSIKTKGTGVDSLPDGNGPDNGSNGSPIKMNGGSSSPDDCSQLINGANNGDDGHIGSGQVPGTPVDSSGAASPIIGEPGLSSLANGSL